MSDSEQKFLGVVEQVCAKPGLYVGRPDFRALVTFLEGYIRGLTESGRLESYPFGSLLTLLEHEHGFSHPAWGWWRHYLHDKKTDAKAIMDFPEFLGRAMAVPRSRIDELHAVRPSSHQSPVSSQTEKYDL